MTITAGFMAASRRSLRDRAVVGFAYDAPTERISGGSQIE
jgi:hypothetical protein